MISHLQHQLIFNGNTTEQASMISKTIEDLLIEVAKREGCYPGDILWYSWPQSFASTSGPRGGIGGCAITSFQVFAFDPPTGKRQKYCAGVWKNWSGEPDCRW